MAEQTPPAGERPGWRLCGTEPEPGEQVWGPEGQTWYVEPDGSLRPAARVPEPRAPEALHVRLLEAMLCPACLLPKFVPGHRFRGCSQ